MRKRFWLKPRTKNADLLPSAALLRGAVMFLRIRRVHINGKKALNSLL